MTVVVTGANGFLGNAVVLKLVSQASLVRALVRSKATDDFVQSGLLDVVVGDFSSISSCHKVLQSATYLVHCAARVHVMNDKHENPLSEFRAINVEGTLNLGRQAAAAGVKRFIFISSIKVNGEGARAGQAYKESDHSDPQDPYAISKHEAEQGLRQVAADTGMDVVIIRPPLVYGPGVKANFAALMNVVKRGLPLPLGAIHNQRSLIALDNLVDFIITCINHPNAANQTFLISDGRDLSTSELIRTMAKAAGVPARLIPVPVPMLKLAGRLLGKGDVVQRLCGNLQVDISKARNLLGWSPPISVEEGIRRAMMGGV